MKKSRLSRLKIEDARSKGSAKIAVAMSGGVDSGVAAALVVKAGFQAAGFHMRLWQEPEIHLRGVSPPKAGPLHLGGGKSQFENKCCDLESLEAARKTCHQLGIPFYIIDFEKIFKKRVVDYFLAEYAAGRTPNPCVRCNQFIKFGKLLDYVQGLGYDYLATGHYARISRDGALVAHRNFGSASDFLAPRLRSGQASKKVYPEFIEGQGEASQNLMGSPRLSRNFFHLLTGRDKSKDQSYFLYNLTQKQLAHLLFPVGDYLKKEVVAMAKKWRLPAGRQGLPVAERPESQEVCFFKESDYRPFLRRQIKEKIVSGEVVDTKGKVIGQHQGLPLYTIGQRHGFEVKSGGGKWEVSREVGVGSGVIPPFYVIAKDVEKNRLVVGFGKETEREEFLVKDVNWLSVHPRGVPQAASLTCQPRLTVAQHHLGGVRVRLRHQGELLDCKVIQNTQNARRKNVSRITYHVSLSHPQRGIAPGQAAVFYRKLKIENGKWKMKSKNSKLERLKNKPFAISYSPLTTLEVLGGGVISFNERL